MSIRPVVVDDRLLLDVLVGHEVDALAQRRAPLFTTGLWYHRLCRALARPGVQGSMIRQVGNALPEVASGVIGAATALPDSIGLISLRSLAWPMAEVLAEGHRLNVLSLEALAAARHLDAEIVLAAADDNRPLRRAAEELDIPVRLAA